MPPSALAGLPRDPAFFDAAVIRFQRITPASPSF